VGIEMIPQMNAENTDVFIVRLPLHGLTRINAKHIYVIPAQAEVQRLNQIENRILVRKQRKQYKNTSE